MTIASSLTPRRIIVKGRWIPATCAVALITLAGCTGGDSSDGPTKCSTLWVVGETLPADYEGFCQEGDRKFDAYHTVCEDGKRRMFVHQNETGTSTHIAITGEVIQDYSEDVDAALYANCQPDD